MNGEVSSVEMEVSSRPLIPDVSSRAGVLIRWRDGLRHRGVLEGWMMCARPFAGCVGCICWQRACCRCCRQRLRVGGEAQKMGYERRHGVGLPYVACTMWVCLSHASREIQPSPHTPCLPPTAARVAASRGFRHLPFQISQSNRTLRL